MFSTRDTEPNKHTQRDYKMVKHRSGTGQAVGEASTGFHWARKQLRARQMRTYIKGISGWRQAGTTKWDVGTGPSGGKGGEGGVGKYSWQDDRQLPTGFHHPLPKFSYPFLAPLPTTLDIPCSLPDASEILYTGRAITAPETLYHPAKPTTMAVLSDAAGRKDKDYVSSAVASPH
ncbi:hypothetical protein Pcinc_021584 [Petrolisthes cinctipes]|uniref:Uncharacterized protein n=1 Tax=Petrolisthes cinctipes TaxID=88211 RepID=A0AAE1FJR2_PETCI|nr:hypothetical protein Pcinc_021584 [Petrolisthes cinctipes]